jgi:hypothetical protein
MKNVHHRQQQKIERLTQASNTTQNDAKCNSVENRTSIHVTNEEMQLLSKGLKYNLHYKHKKWIKTLALEAETAIMQLAATEQNYYRHAIAKQLKNINQKSNIINKRNIVECKTISNIKKKIAVN